MVSAHRRTVILLALSVWCGALTACADGPRGTTTAGDATANTTNAESAPAIEPVPTAIVLDYYGQIRGDACERLATKDDTLEGGTPAGATSPLNAGPPAPEDEPARSALDQLPVPASWPLIDERTTASMDEPSAHGIQRTWCIPTTASTAEVAALLSWASAHGELVGEAGVPVLLDAQADPDAWRMLHASARLRP